MLIHAVWNHDWQPSQQMLSWLSVQFWRHCALPGMTLQTYSPTMLHDYWHAWLVMPTYILLDCIPTQLILLTCDYWLLIAIRCPCQVLNCRQLSIVKQLCVAWIAHLARILSMTRPKVRGKWTVWRRLGLIMQQSLMQMLAWSLISERKADSLTLKLW